METAATVTHPVDIAYVCANFLTLEELCRGCGIPEETVRRELAGGTRARAAYRFGDGREFFPRNYFAVCFERDEFFARMRHAAKRDTVEFSQTDLDGAWQTYLAGIYFVCLNEATPENIVRKNALLQRIERLVSDPHEADSSWFRTLRESVDALDSLERPFSPYFDRVIFGRPPTRDSHIRDVRVRFGV